MMNNQNSDTAGESVNCCNHPGKLAVPVEVKCPPSVNPEIPLLGIYPQEMNTYLQKRLVREYE